MLGKRTYRWIRTVSNPLLGAFLIIKQRQARKTDEQASVYIYMLFSCGLVPEPVAFSHSVLDQKTIEKPENPHSMEKVKEFENLLRSFIWLIGCLNGVIIIQIIACQVMWKRMIKDKPLSITKELSYKLSGDVDRMLKEQKRIKDFME